MYSVLQRTSLYYPSAVRGHIERRVGRLRIPPSTLYRAHNFSFPAITRMNGRYAQIKRKEISGALDAA